MFQVPQIDPSGKNQDPEWRQNSNGLDSTKAIASFLSPIYERLETNIPRGLMGFQKFDWPKDSQLFPKHETVLQYIQDYGKDIEDLVQYETQVMNVEATDASRDGQWNVTTRKLRDNTERDEVFDAIIVANGHFIVPYLPEIPGVKEWNAQYPGAILHSKYYRRPEDFSGKKVVVIGNSASGSDISTQICQYSSNPLIWSTRSPSIFSPTSSSLKREVPPIKEFLIENRAVEFEDGTIETDIDTVLFATGYLYSLPFLENVRPKLITDGSHVNHTYQHLFYAPRPTLSFLALNQRVIPFPLAEAQSAVLACVYSGLLSLPSLSIMQWWEWKVQEELGNGRNFHLLPFPKDADYINEMSSWAITSFFPDGENGCRGKWPPIWRNWEYWCRENFPAIRVAFTSLGEKKAEVTTLEEVGFDYEEHLKRKAAEWNPSMMRQC
jgi:cation diffusion facilitator CzcD-associated flavoprotein CzcO